MNGATSRKNKDANISVENRCYTGCQTWRSGEKQGNISDGTLGATQAAN